jgi:LacI family transcriptional regulator
VVTTRHVAQRAGVSVSTVSHVLNATRFVSDDLRQRVQQALDELGYEPNAVARSLKVNRSTTLGLIISDISNPFFTELVRGVEDVAQANGYTLVLCNSDENPAKEQTYLRELRARRVDGLLVAPAGEAHEYLRKLVRANFPLVFLDRDVASLPVPTVLLDNEAAAYAAVRHLIQLGHRRIGAIIGRPLISTTTERFKGYARALREAGIEIDQRLVVNGRSRIDGGAEAADVLMALEERPTALFSGNNLMTLGALGAFKARDLVVPDDVALVGIDDFPWASVLRPHLTTVAQPTYELGRRAAELLLGLMHGTIERGPHRVVLQGKLIVRESCGASQARAADGRVGSTRAAR